jgi:hypothetical protein
VDRAGRRHLPLDLFLREVRRHYGEQHVMVGKAGVFVRGEMRGGKFEPKPEDLRPPLPAEAPLAS